jgi:hypothetical protein
MPNLAHVVQRLRKERHRAQRRVDRMDEALKALTDISGVRRTTTRHGRAQASGANRRRRARSYAGHSQSRRL